MNFKNDLVFLGLDCDTSRDSVDNRIGGPNSCRVKPHSKPWIVRLNHEGKPHNMKGHTCGGSLISTNVILTAAHCVCTFEELITIFEGGPLNCIGWKSQVAFIGDHDIMKEEGEQIIGFKYMTFHPNFIGM